jgi:predicted flap endonuclease-1-like 5' DNA nuclease
MDFSKFFNEMTNEYSLFFIVCMLVAFLIGFLTAWWARGVVLSRLRKALKISNEENFQLSRENETLNERHVLLLAELKRAKDDAEAHSVARRRMELDKNAAFEEMHSMKERFELSEKEKTYALEELAALKNTYLDAQQQLAAGLGLSEDTLGSSKAEITRLSGELAAAEAELARLRGAEAEVDFVANPPQLLADESEDIDDLLREAKASIEAKGFYNDMDGDGLIDDLEVVEQNIAQDLLLAQDLPQAEPMLATPDFELSDEDKAIIDTALHNMPISVQHLLDSNDDAQDDLNSQAPTREGINKEQAIAAVKASLGSKLPLANVDLKDDLKKINGIGPFIERKLNDLGIYTFEQVSKFDEELIEQITDAIEFFPGRIVRDNWVEQAKALIQA